MKNKTQRRESYIFIIIFTLAAFLLLQFPEVALAQRTPRDKRERDFVHKKKKSLMHAEELFLKGDYNQVVDTCEDVLRVARKLAGKLKKKGYTPYIFEVRSSDSTFFRVRVGKAESRAEAQHLANRLKKEGFQVKIYP